MSTLDQELVEFLQQRIIQRAQAAQWSRQARPNRFDLHHRLLMKAGDSLITLGLKLKNLSRPAGEHDYNPQYT